MLEHLKNETNRAFTDNGAVAHATTLDFVLDFFAQGGSLRHRSEEDILSLFTGAFGQDPARAMRTLFYFRDIQGGQGERKTFRTIYRYLANNHTEVAKKNLHLIAEFGRYDDYYTLVGTKLERDMFALLKAQFEEDMNSETPTLLGKWLKSENASSHETKEFAKKTRLAFGLTPRQYRKALTSLRKKINIVEQNMSSKNWSAIHYDKVPSKASIKYRSAFHRQDGERYTAYLDALEKGETKINTGTLYPYELVRQANYQEENDRTLDLAWENLPDYIGNSEENAICVVDVSGSMSGLPMDVAVSLGLYMAERNKGPYHNHFITFSARPQLVEVKGSTLSEKVHNMKKADWGMNTNIEAVFDLILNTAIQHNLTQEQIINKIYIVSDMNFDAATSSYTGWRNEEVPVVDNVLFDRIKNRYLEKNLTLPKLVFWNVNSSSTQFPMTMNDEGVQMVSGCSPVIFKNLLADHFMSAIELMLDVIDAERYQVVQV